jgi:hypothetical protein
MNFKTISQEFKKKNSEFVHGWKWYLLFLPALPVISVYAAKYCAWDSLLVKGYHETAALVLIGLTTLSFLTRTLLEKTKLSIILLALSFSFFCRELHFTGTHKGIYVALILIGIWAFAWRKYISENFLKENMKSFLTATFWLYLFSQIIARRAFKHILPDEKLLHIPFEEVTENFAHLMFLITSFLGWQKKSTGKEDSK